MAEKPLLAVIGGSGLYRFEGLEDARELDVDTPFGHPSAPIVTSDPPACTFASTSPSADKSCLEKSGQNGSAVPTCATRPSP
ncbi:MAG: hypothetical protein WBV22_05450, partial [Anaerolineaceae bacterium]